MNSEKWREVTLTRETILDLVAAHLYAMRGADRKEITNLEIPGLIDMEHIKIRLKKKEVKSQKTSLVNRQHGQKLQERVR